MGFKVRLDEIQMVRGGIGSLPKMAQKPSYAFKRIADNLKAELRIYQGALLDIYKELGALDAAENKYKVEPDKQEELNRRIGELNQVEVQIDHEPVKLADCVARGLDGKPEPVDIEPDVLMRLGAAISE